MDINNVSCYRLRTILHLEIQKGKEAMKASNFQHNIGGTVEFMKRLMMDKKGFFQLTPRDTYFDYSWSGGVKNAEE